MGKSNVFCSDGSRAVNRHDLTRAVERSIVRVMVHDILKAGYSITVDDGEAYPVKRCIYENDVMAALFSVDEERVHIHKFGGAVIGTVLLVHGNDGHDVIADYTANQETERLLFGANAKADEFQQCM